MERWLFLIGIVAFASGCYSANSAAPFLDAGNAAIAKKEWAQALEQFDEALRVDPQSRDALRGRGTVYERAGNVGLAIRDYELLLALEPNNIEVLKKVVSLYVDIEDAESAYSRLPKLKGRIADSEFVLTKGRISLLRNDLDVAVQSLDQAVILVPKNATAWYFHALALTRSGRHADAEESFTKAIANDRLFAAAFWQRSRVRLRLGRQELAELDERAAAELDPRLTFAESSVGESALKSLQGSEALQPFGQPSP